jgi:hypothetical protein
VHGFDSLMTAACLCSVQILAKRKGFVKIALQTGAKLVSSNWFAIQPPTAVLLHAGMMQPTGVVGTVLTWLQGGCCASMYLAPIALLAHASRQSAQCYAPL